MSECKSNFLEVKCLACSSKQVVFSKPSTVVRCLVCDSVLAKPGAKKGSFNAKVLKVI